MGAGLAVAARSLVVTGLIAVYLAATIGAAIRTEETFLKRTFGEEHARYHSGAAAASSASRRFSLERAIANGEHRTVVGLAVAALLLVLKGTYNGLFWRAAGR
jgi:hypothetical protein